MHGALSMIVKGKIPIAIHDKRGNTLVYGMESQIIIRPMPSFTVRCDCIQYIFHRKASSAVKLALIIP